MESSSSSSSTFQSSLTRSGPQYGSLLSMPIHSNVAIRKPSRNDDHHDEKKTLLPTVVVDESAAAPAPVVARDDRSTTTHRTFFRKLSSHFFPAQWDIIEVVVVPGTADVDMDMDMNNVWSSRSSSRSVDLPCNEQHRTTSRSKPKTNKVHRSMTRRFHLLLTEPDSSVASAIFFFILVITITLMNVIMVLQTMDRFQYTPSDCLACGGHLSNAFDDDGISTRTTTKSSMTTTDAAATALQHNVTCVCPPAPLRWTVTCLDHLIYFFTVEWSLRLLTFTPAPNERTVTVVGRCAQWLGFLTSSSMVLDGLAIFPYYFEILGGTSSNGLMPLRLLRLFRVFQLVRLGQYNASFTALTRVMVQSIVYLKLLVGVLLFCAVFFGSMIYWLERGEWQYWPPTKSWEFVRESIHQGSGIYELSPFTSIPRTFWWFLVTATTVGYGDQYPTSTAGKWVATGAMLMGIFVIAFPVSVFSDLWSKELRRSGALASLLEDNEDNDDSNDECDTDIREKEKGGGSCNRSNIGNEQDPISQLDASASAAQFHSSGPSSMAAAAPFSMPHQPSLDWPDVGPYNTRGDHHGGGDTIVLEKNDLADILVQLHCIQDSQRQIRHILRKYKIQLDPPGLQRQDAPPRGIL